jgi:HAD superfamily phosphatase
MHTPGVWSKPNLRYPEPLDTIFFDIDGTLIETSISFHAADIATAEYITGTLQGLDWGQQEGKKLLTLEDVEAFKQAGGYNNDWDMSYLLSALTTARLREWKGTPLAERTSQQWAVLARAAHLQGHGGRAWVEHTLPASALVDYGIVGDIYHEYYWGAQELSRRYGLPARYLPDAGGFFHLEEMLYAPDFIQRLREAGIQHFGLITGRVGPEVDSALERMEAYSGESWWEVVIPANVSAKPNPTALRLAIEAVKARGGLYIGDTADDLDLVRNYRASQAAHEPHMLVAMNVPAAVFATYMLREPDFIMQSVEDLLLYLHRETNSL